MEQYNLCGRFEMQQVTIHRLEGGRRSRGDVRSKTPLFSIITVVFRDKDELERILKNVFTFDSADFEVIVIDGASKDGTVELLQRWDDKIDYWLSEPDSGIYDAMNKGIAAALGDYIFHLNAGDTLNLVPYETLAACLKERVDVASFAVQTDQGEIFRPTAGNFLWLFNTWHHQGTFYLRSPEMVYDTSYRTYADFDLNQRLFKSGKKVRLFDEVVSIHSTAGISHSGQDEHEKHRSIRKNFGLRYVILGYFWPYYQKLPRALKRVIAFAMPTGKYSK